MAVTAAERARRRIERRNEKYQDKRIRKNNLGKENKKPGVDIDSRNQYNPDAKNSDECVKFGRNCGGGRDGGRRKKITPPPIKRYTQSNKLESDSKSLTGSTPGSKTEYTGTDIEHGTTSSTGKNKITNIPDETTWNDEGNQATIKFDRTKVETVPDPNRLKDKSVYRDDDIGNYSLESGKDTRRNKRVADMMAEEKAKADAFIAQAQPGSKTEGNTMGKGAVKPTEKGDKALSSYSKSSRSTQLDDSPWTQEGRKSLSSTNRRGKTKTYTLDEKGKGSKYHSSSKASITNRRGKTREVDASKIEDKMARAENRFDRRVMRQANRTRTKVDPSSIARRKKFRADNREGNRFDRKLDRKRRKGARRM